MKNNSSIIQLLKTSILIWPVLALIACLSSCDVEEEPIPSYLTIEAFELLPTEPSVHGSVSQKITNGRVFFTDVNDGSVQNLGTVTLPTTIPVLATGEQKVTIDPVIKGGGNSFFLEIYPFYNRYETVVNLPPNGDVTVSPKTTYRDDIVFEFIEGFEGSVHRFREELDGNDNTFIEISTEDVFEGEASGKIHLDTGNIVIVVATNELYEFDFESAGRVYMEVNYKTEVPIQFGVQAVNTLGQTESIFEYQVFDNEEWNKIYFDLTPLMSNRTERLFSFILRAGLPIENGAFALDEADIYLDNIKVVHF